MMIAVAMETTMNPGGNIAYGVVTGIGFLGGGAIIRYGRSVRGLVTGASIWSSAVIPRLRPRMVRRVRNRRRPGPRLPVGPSVHRDAPQPLSGDRRGPRDNQPRHSLSGVLRELPELQFEVLDVCFDPGFGEENGGKDPLQPVR